MVHDPLFHLGVVPIHPFGVSAAIGVIVAYIVTATRVRANSINARRLPSTALILTLGSLMFARLGYVALHTGIHDAQSALALWQGGLNFPIGLLGGVVLLALLTWAHSESYWAWSDALAPGVALGLACGLLGLPASGEGFGLPASGPLAMHVDPNLRPLVFVNNANFTPIFAYEALLYAALALLTGTLSSRKRGPDYVQGTAGLTFVSVGLLCYALLQPQSLDALSPQSVFIKQTLCAVAIACAVGVLVALRLAKHSRTRAANEVTLIQRAVEG